MASAKSLFKRRAERVRFALKKKNTGRVRLTVFRSNQHIYAQLVNDATGQTLASASTTETEVASDLKNKSNSEAAKVVGIAIAKKAKALKVTEVVFDRGGYLFHGRVKALADAARKAGLKF